MELAIKPVTLLFGQNSAGKSTVLHALNYLYDIFNHHNLNADTASLTNGSIDLGGFKQFVHLHDLENDITLGLHLDLSRVDLLETDAALSYLELFQASLTDNEISRFRDLGKITEQIQSVELELKISWSRRVSAPYVSQLDISYDGIGMIKVVCTSDLQRREITHLNMDHPVFFGGDEIEEGPVSIARDIVSIANINDSYVGREATLIGITNSPDALPRFNQPLKIADIWQDEEVAGERELAELNAKGRAEFRSLLNIIMVAPLEVAANTLAQMKYLGPIREIPERRYSPLESHRVDWSDGLAAWDLLFRREGDLLPRVNSWLKSTGYQVRIVDNLQMPVTGRLASLLSVSDLNSHAKEIQEEVAALNGIKHFELVDERRGGVSVYPEDVGIGISQVLPIVISAFAREISLLMVEQPELHAHPGLQTTLGDLMIEGAEGGRRFIFETHSEHILLRLLRRIRENYEADTIARQFSPDDINVVYVSCIDGETRLTPLGIGDDGEFIDRWPEGFFEERLEEL